MRDGESGKRDNGQRKYYVEVQQKIEEVEIPRLGAVQFGPTLGASKHVVSNNIPRDNGRPSVHP
jgi:hypothetical protein